MLLLRAFGTAIAASLIAAQTTPGDSTASGTGTPCAEVSASVAAVGASPSAVTLDATVAYQCALSAPVVQADALQLIDSLTDVLEWQTTLAFLKNPPSEYPMAGVDLMGELANLRSQVTSGAITSELVLQTNITSVLAHAHEGHIWYYMDAFSVFSYQRPYGPLVSYSLDGIQTPELYLFFEMQAYNNNNGDFPSAITSINGMDPVQFLEQLGQNGTTSSQYQDPDALYNDALWTATNNASPEQDNGGGYWQPQYYPGETTTLEFANGTSATGYNVALTSQDFTGVVDGLTFYNAFCNSTAKVARSSSTNTQASRVIRRLSSTPTITQLPLYPSPYVISQDGAVSGYFLSDPGYESVAVLVLDFMSETAQMSAQSTVTSFLNECRSQNMTHLVIDITGNPGGAVVLGYDIFKQLFPTIEPYGAGNQRCTPALNATGTYVTEAAAEVMKSDSSNVTAYEDVGGASDFNAVFYNNDSGSPFTSWNSYYGPVTANSDNFTNLQRWRYENYATYDIEGITISGYGRQVGAQPFQSENIIIVGDGRCSSTCTIFSHLMKWQGKVKSIAIGGRPVAGPMQSQGGTKGSAAYSWPNLFDNFVLWASNFPSDVTGQSESNVALTTFSKGISYILTRTTSYGTPSYATSSDFSFNGRNNIAEYDTSYTPLQFRYEAADCRLWAKTTYMSPVEYWYDAATTAFGLNGTTPYAMCVKGSTNAPSSLSGNSTLYKNGTPNNVTSFIQQDSSSNGGSGGKKKNAAGQVTVSLFLAVSLAAMVGFALQ